MAHTISTMLHAAGSAAAKPFRAVARIRRVCTKLLNIIVIWQERSEQRQVLGELNERMLKDIGVTGADAYNEARKPFWLP